MLTPKHSELFDIPFYQFSQLKMTGFPISPVIGAHLGPDAVGVGWVEELM